jgi:hypothetical protein
MTGHRVLTVSGGARDARIIDLGVAQSRAIQSGGWPAFGFIVSEVELRRLR